MRVDLRSLQHCSIEQSKQDRTVDSHLCACYHVQMSHLRCIGVRSGNVGFCPTMLLCKSCRRFETWTLSFDVDLEGTMV